MLFKMESILQYRTGSICGLILVTLVIAPVKAQSTERSDEKFGFQCQGINTISSISFNVDMKQKRIEWENGDEDKIVIKVSEISIYRDPYIAMNSPYLISKTLDRTSLIYRSFYALKNTDEKSLLEYQCQIMPAYNFGSQRKF